MPNQGRGAYEDYDALGDLHIRDKAGNTIAEFDGQNRKLIIPASSELEVAGTLDFASASVTLPTRTAIIDLEPLLLGADGAALAASETAGDFFRQVGTNQLYIQGEASQNETEASVGWLEFTLPENYVPGGTISLVAVVDVTGTGTLGTCTVDFEARLSDNDGAVGSDLVSTGATAVTATAGAKTFVVTPTDLVAGNKLVVKLTTSIQETMNMAAIQAIITKLYASIQVNK